MSLREKYLEHKRTNDKFSELSIENIRIMCDTLSERFTTNYGTAAGAGLLVGEVQSGKTSNFLTLGFDVMDKQLFDIVIILGGTINDLKYQTVSRLSDFVKNIDEVQILDIDSTILSSKNELRESLEASEKFFITCLKEKTNLENLLSLIRGLDRRILIIDDESDQATLNNYKSTRDEFGKIVFKPGHTKIHSLITDLKNSTEDVFLLLVTATPYANLTGPSKDDIAPKWGYVLKSGEGYCGLDEFHGEHGDFRDGRIRQIENFYVNGEKFKLSNKLSNSTIEEMSWYDSQLSKSLLSFIVGNEITKEIIGDGNSQYQMLIHSHSQKGDHDLIEEYVKAFFTNYQKELNGKDDLIKSLRSSAINEEFDAFLNQLSEHNTNLAIERREAIIDSILKRLKNWKSTIYINVNNSDNEKHPSHHKILTHNKDEIIIGADKIQRGITFKNLRLTFMPRLATESVADTILQRARWFGYRGEIAEFTTIFLTEKLIWLFNNYVSIKDEINDFLTHNFSNNLNLRNIDKIINVPGDANSSIGRLTRKTVNPIEGHENSLSSIIQKFPIRNYDIEESLINKLLENDINNEFQDMNFSTIKLPFAKADKQLLEIIFDKLYLNMPVKNFYKLCEKNNNTHIVFSLMKYNVKNKKLDYRTRSLQAEKEEDITENSVDIIPISALQQGKNASFNFKEEDRFKFYAGDRNILSYYYKEFEENVVEIQIHNISPFIKGKKEKLFEERYMYTLKFGNHVTHKYYYTRGVNVKNEETI